ncbi:MAG TPA: polyphosphate kinase 2 family protein [Thermoplasmata archaeon]|nr:polyphosphate kinase 2 family protein [Thermoplasmata archaeon]
MLKHLVRPGVRLRLDRTDPADTSGFEGVKDDGRKELERLTARLERLQELLYAGHAHSILVVLQGMDSAGKDGTIRRVFQGVNPQGVRVASFKAPSAHEAEHDFLWRVHEQIPARGEMVLFNRSHYEDVLYPRVHGLITKPVWERRYREINGFERTLAGEGTTILKFFLHISRDEQKKRLEARLDDPTKHWKFRESDVRERRRWTAYTRAYEDALSNTSTSWAPWYVVPSDRKWYRDLIVSERIVDALEKLRMKYPPLPPELRSARIR